jgi:hypothetical protein
MTAAALEIQQGHNEQAIRLVEQARDADQSRLDALFAACVSDRFFAVASQNNPDLARACTVAGQKPAPTPGAEGAKSDLK